MMFGLPAHAENRFKKYLVPTLEVDLAIHGAELNHTIKLEKVLATAWSDQGMLISSMASLNVTWLMSVDGNAIEMTCTLVAEEDQTAPETNFYFTVRACSSPQSFDVFPYVSNILDARQYELINGVVGPNKDTRLQAKIRDAYAKFPAGQIPQQACRITATPRGTQQSFTICGGSYVSNKGLLLTARHCFHRDGSWQMPDAEYAVVCGGLEPRRFTQKNVILPNDVKSVSADAALIALDSPLDLQPMRLAMGGAQIQREIHTAVRCSFFVGAKRQTLSPDAFLGITIDAEALKIARYWAIGFQPMMVMGQPNLPLIPRDSGSPLACQRESGEWIQIGMVTGDNEMTKSLLSNPLSNVRKFIFSYL